MREFKTQDSSARLYDPCHLFKGNAYARYVSYAEAHGDAMKGVVRERQFLGVASDEHHVFKNASVQAFIPASFEHLLIYVEDRDASVVSDLLFQEKRYVGRASRHVQRALPLP